MPGGYDAVMQSPILVFDHIRKSVHSLTTGPAADKRLQELMASQRAQVVTSGRPKPK